MFLYLRWMRRAGVVRKLSPKIVNTLPSSTKANSPPAFGRPQGIPVRVPSQPIEPWGPTEEPVLGRDDVEGVAALADDDAAEADLAGVGGSPHQQQGPVVVRLPMSTFGARWIIPINATLTRRSSPRPPLIRLVM